MPVATAKNQEERREEEKEHKGEGPSIHQLVITGTSEIEEKQEKETNDIHKFIIVISCAGAPHIKEGQAHHLRKENFKEIWHEQTLDKRINPPKQQRQLPQQGIQPPKIQILNRTQWMDKMEEKSTQRMDKMVEKFDNMTEIIQN